MTDAKSRYKTGASVDGPVSGELYLRRFDWLYDSQVSSVDDRHKSVEECSTLLLMCYLAFFTFMKSRDIKWLLEEPQVKGQDGFRKADRDFIFICIVTLHYISPLMFFNVFTLLGVTSYPNDLSGCRGLNS